MIRVLALLTGLAAAPLAQAHPHIFVDVELRFLAGADGRLEGVEVTWTYDDFYSLLILEDRGADPDGDLELTEAERAMLTGFDLADWPEGFEGALFIESHDGKVALGPPEPTHLSLDWRGRIVSRHVRSFAPVAPAGLVARPYDPYFFAALDLVGVRDLPEGCTGRIIPADNAAADALVARLRKSMSEDFFDEVAVGIHYADTLEVTCEPSS